MGKLLVTALIENLFDLENLERGLIPPEQVRRIEVTDALIDTGATGLMLPKRMIAQLGLRLLRTRSARSVGRIVPMPMHSVARLTIMGRECAMDVGEIPDGLPPLIGQVPLEMLDFVDRYPDMQETPAQFQERCAQIALRCFWNDKFAAEEKKPDVSEVAESLLRPSANGVH